MEVLWRMNKVMHGRRKGPRSWSNYLAAVLALLGVERSRSAPHMFVALKAEVAVEAHADDLHLAGPSLVLERTVKNLTKTGLKLKEALYYAPRAKAEHTHLRRIKRIAPEGRTSSPTRITP